MRGVSMLARAARVGGQEEAAGRLVRKRDFTTK
jgi:hypothetical protein